MARRGGFREGAGRKPATPGGRDIAFRLYPQHLAIIDRWGREHANANNRSAALRHMIETLDAWMADKDERDDYYAGLADAQT